MRVEGPLCHWEAGDEQPLAVFFAEAPLVRRREVDVRYARVGEVHPRDLRRHIGKLDVEQLEGARRALAERFDHARERLAHDGHDLEVVADEAHLRIERGVLGEMARR